MEKEPRINSHIMDCLPEDYKPLNSKVNPYEQIYCDACNDLLHAGNNECMQTWVETEEGNFCTNCIQLSDVLNGLENILTPEAYKKFMER